MVDFKTQPAETSQLLVVAILTQPADVHQLLVVVDQTQLVEIIQLLLVVMLTLLADLFQLLAVVSLTPLAPIMQPSPVADQAIPAIHPIQTTKPRIIIAPLAAVEATKLVMPTQI